MNFFLMLYLSFRLLYLLPSECVHVDSDGILPTELAQAADLYKEDLPHCVMLSTEYSMWTAKRKQQHAAGADIPNKLVDALHFVVLYSSTTYMYYLDWL